jgi:hypothetical protein
MTEAELRAIIRDEIEEQTLKVGGIYDECRKMTFGMTKAMVEQVFKHGLATFAEPNTMGAGETPHPTDGRTAAKPSHHKSNIPRARA